jgi:hypothetical protein
MYIPSSDTEAKTLLLEEFPEFYGEMEGRFFLPKGWYPLLKILSQKILLVLKPHPDVELEVGQVKEKMGGLRFYWTLSKLFDNPQLKDKITELVNQAEEDSYQICQVCGLRGERRFSKGLFSTLCSEH